MSHSEPNQDWEDVARSAAGGLAAGVEADGPEDLRELLVFGLEGSAYAIAVERIREIVRMRELTQIPRSPTWLLGVIVLRGEVVEVVDLRSRLGLSIEAPKPSGRIIVLHGDAERVTGLLVDSVSEVYRVPEDQVLPAQGFEISSVTEMCRRGDDFISILDSDAALEIIDG